MRVSSVIIILTAVKYNDVQRHEDALYGPSAISDVLRSVFVLGWLWQAAVCFPKAAILCLYLRIFNIGKLRTLCRFMVFFVFLSSILFSIASCFWCIPLKAFWNTPNEGNCMNYELLWKFSCIPNVVVDVIIMLIPLPTLYSL